MNINFGKYDVPSTLQTLIQLKNQLENHETFYDAFHFYLTLSDFRYFNTPCDVVVFGHIGADGIHYGFLTDFGTVSNLEEAPIVCVSPMDSDQPTRIIAKNIREFLKLNRTDAGLFYNNFANEESYDKYKKELLELYPPSTEEMLKSERVLQILMEQIELPTIENAFQLIQSTQLERRKIVSIQTQDGLGVTAPFKSGETHIPFELNQQTKLDIEALQNYLSFAPIPSRQAAIRAIQIHFVLPHMPLVKEIVVHAMQNSGFSDEANRIAFEF